MSRCQVVVVVVDLCNGRNSVVGLFSVVRFIIHMISGVVVVVVVVFWYLESCTRIKNTFLLKRRYWKGKVYS